MTKPISYEKACFVIMPFYKKKVGKKTVDFDVIYREVFKPGIAIPFIINSINVFDYEFDSKKKIADSRVLITEVLTNSLQRNRLDLIAS